MVIKTQLVEHVGVGNNWLRHRLERIVLVYHTICLSIYDAKEQAQGVIGVSIYQNKIYQQFVFQPNFNQGYHNQNWSTSAFRTQLTVPPACRIIWVNHSIHLLLVTIIFYNTFVFMFDQYYNYSTHNPFLFCLLFLYILCYIYYRLIMSTNTNNGIISKDIDTTAINGVEESTIPNNGNTINIPKPSSKTISKGWGYFTLLSSTDPCWINNNHTFVCNICDNWSTTISHRAANKPGLITYMITQVNCHLLRYILIYHTVKIKIKLVSKMKTRKRMK